MKKTIQHFEDKDKGQYTTVEDAPMIALLNKLEELAGSSHVKIYWRTHHSYKDNCEMIWIYGIFPELKHEVSLANECGSGRRIWLEHHFQHVIGEAVSPIFIFSEPQIEAFDRLFKTWMEVGKDGTQSDDAVAEDILRLRGR